MSNSLEERLKTHLNAFDGLLSLIPSKYYYDDSTQDQWQQKKKSKAELKENKRNKLDPENREFEDNLSAKEVMDNKAKEAKPVRLPQKIVRKEVVEEDSDEPIPDMEVDDEEDEEDDVHPEPSINETHDEDSIQIAFDDEGNELGDQSEAQKLVQKKEQLQQQQKKKKELTDEQKKQKQENLKKLREKLASKINTLREKRRAPGSRVSGAPKSREQILEERKKKAELRKEERLKRKHEEVDESSDSSDSEEEDNDTAVVFGNITFNDGTRVTSDLSKMRSTAEKKKGKGPSNNDIKAHLQRLERKKQKLAKMSPEEKAKELEKDKWSRLMNQAEGVKVKDDEKLLKKALKRKERKKLRSEIEWKERKRVVQDTIAAKAKRREENLKARRENKGKKSKNQVRLKKFTGIANSKKKRAGFEGSAKLKKK